VYQSAQAKKALYGDICEPFRASGARTDEQGCKAEADSLASKRCVGVVEASAPCICRLLTSGRGTAHLSS